MRECAFTKETSETLLPSDLSCHQRIKLKPITNFRLVSTKNIIGIVRSEDHFSFKNHTVFADLQNVDSEAAFFEMLAV